MSTRAGRREPQRHRPVEDGSAPTRDARQVFSLRPRDALAGAIALMAIASGALIIAGESRLGDDRTLFSRMLSTLVLVFAPSILAAVYSLFFEKSKIYGSLDLLLAGIVILKMPFAWFWLRLYWPVACVFTLFCAAVRLLDLRLMDQRGRR